MKSVLRNIVLKISLLFSIPILIPKYDPLLRILSNTMSHKKSSWNTDIPSFCTCRKSIFVRLNFRGRRCLYEIIKWRLIVLYHLYSENVVFHLFIDKTFKSIFSNV